MPPSLPLQLTLSLMLLLSLTPPWHCLTTHTTTQHLNTSSLSVSIPILKGTGQVDGIVYPITWNVSQQQSQQQSQSMDKGIQCSIVRQQSQRQQYGSDISQWQKYVLNYHVNDGIGLGTDETGQHFIAMAHYSYDSIASGGGYSTYTRVYAVTNLLYLHTITIQQQQQQEGGGQRKYTVDKSIMSNVYKMKGVDPLCGDAEVWVSGGGYMVMGCGGWQWGDRGRQYKMGLVLFNIGEAAMSSSSSSSSRVIEAMHQIKLVTQTKITLHSSDNSDQLYLLTSDTVYQVAITSNQLLLKQLLTAATNKYITMTAFQADNIQYFWVIGSKEGITLFNINANRIIVKQQLQQGIQSEDVVGVSYEGRRGVLHVGYRRGGRGKVVVLEYHWKQGEGQRVQFRRVYRHVGQSGGSAGWMGYDSHDLSVGLEDQGQQVEAKVVYLSAGIGMFVEGRRMQMFMYGVQNEGNADNIQNLQGLQNIGQSYYHRILALEPIHPTPSPSAPPPSQSATYHKSSTRTTTTPLAQLAQYIILLQDYINIIQINPYRLSTLTYTCFISPQYLGTATTAKQGQSLQAVVVGIDGVCKGQAGERGEGAMQLCRHQERIELVVGRGSQWEQEQAQRHRWVGAGVAMGVAVLGLGGLGWGMWARGRRRDIADRRSRRNLREEGSFVSENKEKDEGKEEGMEGRENAE